MGRVIACGIPQGAGQETAEGDEPAEYRREQDTKKARRKRPSGIPQGAELNRTPEYCREQNRNGGIPARAGQRERKTDGRKRAK